MVLNLTNQYVSSPYKEEIYILCKFRDLIGKMNCDF